MIVSNNINKSDVNNINKDNWINVSVNINDTNKKLL